MSLPEFNRSVNESPQSDRGTQGQVNDHRHFIHYIHTVRHPKHVAAPSVRQHPVSPFVSEHPQVRLIKS